MKSHIKNIDDETLKMRLANGAIDKLLVEGEDYFDANAKFKADFGYFHHFGDGIIESFFKIETDKTTVYFSMEGKTLTRLEITEEMYRFTVDKYLKLHPDRTANPKRKVRDISGDNELKLKFSEHALAMLVKTDDAGDPAIAKMEVGYMYDVEGTGYDVLFKLKTAKTTAYFAVLGDEFMRLNFTEEQFIWEIKEFYREHGIKR